MDISSLIGMATQAFDKDGNGRVDMQEVIAALGPLLGGLQGGAQGGSGLDLAGLVTRMQQSGLGNKAQSWLEDGPNEPVSDAQLQTVLGNERIEEFAGRLGLDKTDALHGLEELLPNLVDKSSRGGQLLPGLGGEGQDAAGGMLGSLIGSLFKR